MIHNIIIFVVIYIFIRTKIAMDNAKIINKSSCIKYIDNNIINIIGDINIKKFPYILDKRKHLLSIKIGNHNKPLIVILPGLLGNTLIVLNRLYKLLDKYQVIIMELPGYFNYDKRLENLNCHGTLIYYSKYIDTIMKNLYIRNTKFHFIGHSLGCLVGAMWLNRSKYRHNCNKIIFANPYNNNEFTHIMKYIVDANNHIHIHKLYKNILFYKKILSGSAVWTNNDDVYRLQKLSNMSNNILFNVNNNYINLNNLINKIDKSILFIYGKHDYLFSLKKRTGNNKHKFIVIDDAYHILFNEKKIIVHINNFFN